MRKLSPLEAFLRALSVVAILAMFGTVLLQIAGRHFLPAAPPWTEELGRLLIVWLTAIGAGIALKQDGYRGAVEGIVHLLPAGARKVVTLSFMVLIAGFLGILIHQSVDVMRRNFDVHASALGLPMAYFYLGVLVLGILLLWALLHHAVATLRSGRAAPDGEDGTDPAGKAG
ncbi:TRAP transporter small permease [Rhodospirillaceae bacterium SYSU D60014]|uniref:TRAP transporter small permease n=1 Tax=Virgifigura deserti TaxID=2268457 RepID=UPI000E6682ED